MRNKIIIFIFIPIVILASGFYIYSSFFESKNNNINNINKNENINKESNIEINTEINNEGGTNINNLNIEDSYGYGEIKSGQEYIKIDNAPMINENSAAENCTDVGGVLKKERTGKGTEFWVCYFDNGKSCEGWALESGDCPAGGVDVSIYNTNAEKLCAWLGAKVDKKNNNCVFINKTCPIDALYNEECLPEF